jgi:hypothetical protein
MVKIGADPSPKSIEIFIGMAMKVFVVINPVMLLPEMLVSISIKSCGHAPLTTLKVVQVVSEQPEPSYVVRQAV